MTLLLSEQHDEALAVTRDAYAQANGNAMFAWGLGMAHMAAGQADAGRALLAPLNARSFPALYRGMAHGALGENAHMYDALEQAVAERSDWTYALSRHPWLRPWHGEARFAAIVTQLGLPTAGETLD